MTREEFFKDYNWYIEAIRNEEAVEVSDDGETWEKRFPVGFNFTQSHPFKTAFSQFRYARKPKPKKYRVKPWPEIAMWLCDNLISAYDGCIKGEGWFWNCEMRETCGTEVVPSLARPNRYYYRDTHKDRHWYFLAEWVEEIKE